MTPPPTQTVLCCTRCGGTKTDPEHDGPCGLCCEAGPYSPRYDVTRDDRDIEADALREKLRIAREALEFIADHGRHCGSATCRDSLHEHAERALEKLK